MVLILSHNGYEQATERVIDWLLYYEQPFLRLSANDLLNPGNDWSINVHQGSYTFKGVNLGQHVGCVFNRRFSLREPSPGRGLTANEQLLERELEAETQDLCDFFLHTLGDRFWLPRPAAIAVASNKLTMIPHAVAAGLKVPRGYICRRREQVAQLLQQPGRGWISKPINHCRYYPAGDSVYTAFTIALERSDLDSMPEEFFPSLIQERIAAVAELRVFYLEGHCYTEASFSPQTVGSGEVDIKLRQQVETVHFVPYSLPHSITCALDRLMKRIDLNTGSIDLMLGEDGQYYFLEVNPTGQFSAPSERTNFNLEKKVAELLIRKDREHGRQTSRNPLSQYAPPQTQPRIPQPA